MITTINLSDLLDYMLDHGTEITVEDGKIIEYDKWTDNIVDGLQELNDFETKLSRLALQRHAQGTLQTTNSGE